MRNSERGHHDAILVEHTDRVGSVEQDGDGNHGRTIGRQQLGAVVCDAEAGVGRIRLSEAVDEVGHAVGSVHAQRARATRRPGLQVELAELADVVGVKVRVEDGAYRLPADAPQRERPPAPGPRVDDPHATAGEDRRARLGTSWRRDRRRRPAEQDTERVGREEARRVSPDSPSRDAGDDGVLHPRRPERERARPDHGHRDREERPEDSPPAGMAVQRWLMTRFPPSSRGAPSVRAPPRDGRWRRDSHAARSFRGTPSSRDSAHRPPRPTPARRRR